MGASFKARQGRERHTCSVCAYQGQGTVVMKNWEPLVLGPALAMESRPCEKHRHIHVHQRWGVRDAMWRGAARC